MAPFESLHKLKLIINLIYGIANMTSSSRQRRIGRVRGQARSSTARPRAGPTMLKDIQPRRCAKSFIIENHAARDADQQRQLMAESQIKIVGEKLRAVVPW